VGSTPTRFRQHHFVSIGCIQLRAAGLGERWGLCGERGNKTNYCVVVGRHRFPRSRVELLQYLGARCILRGWSGLVCQFRPFGEWSDIRDWRRDSLPTTATEAGPCARSVWVYILVYSVGACALHHSVWYMTVPSDGNYVRQRRTIWYQIIFDWKQRC
jgi:hypothetical protein